MEIVHVLFGPVVGVIITLLAFSDDFLIKQKLEKFLKDRGVNKALAREIEKLISAAIALATFMGNGYLFLFNCAVAAITFPVLKIYILFGGTTLLAILIVVQAIYTIFRWSLQYMAERLVWGRMPYDVFLRWQQVFINIVTFVYFSRAFGLT
jgi:hypothetical protein